MSGKVYYDLAAARDEAKAWDIEILRLEQLILPTQIFVAATSENARCRACMVSRGTKEYGKLDIHS